MANPVKPTKAKATAEKAGAVMKAKAKSKKTADRQLYCEHCHKWVTYAHDCPYALKK